MNPPGYIDPEYVDVAERIRLFHAKYPDGRLQTVEHGVHDVGGRTFVICKAAAFRTADDSRPCHGLAWEPFPGPTPFTKDSELMNAETSAWGRAIVAAGIPSKKIASADEVKARTAQPVVSTGDVTYGNEPQQNNPVTKGQHAQIGVLVKKIAEASNQTTDSVAKDSRSWCKERFGVGSRAELSAAQASELIDYLNGILELAAVPFS